MTAPTVADTIASVRESLAAQLPSPTHHSDRQPRADGKFSGPVYGTDVPPTVANQQEAVIPAGDLGKAPPVVTTDPPSATPMDPSADGAETPIEEPQGEETEGQPEGTPAITVEMTDRNGHKMAIEVADDATADILRMHQNAYQRRDQLDGERAAFQDQRAEFEGQREQVQLDPIQYLKTVVNDDPAEIGALMLTMCALHPEMIEQVFPELEQWHSDPALLRARVAEIKLAYGARKEQIKKDLTERRIARHWVRDVEGIARSLIPPSIKAEYHDQFIDDCVRDVLRECERIKQRFIHPNQVPDVLRHRLAYAGLREEDIEAAIQRLRPEPKPRPTGKPVVAKPTGPQLVKAATTVKQVAAAPSGAGGQRAGLQLTPKLGVKDTVKALKQSRAFGG